MDKETASEATSAENSAENTALSYWRQNLSGHVPVMEFPTDGPHRAETYRAETQHSFRIPVGLVAALTDTASRNGIGLNTILLAAFEILLWRHSGQNDLVVGVVVTESGQYSDRNLTGHALPIRSSISTSGTFIEYAHQVDAALTTAWKHRRGAVTALAELSELPFSAFFVSTIVDAACDATVDSRPWVALQEPTTRAIPMRTEWYKRTPLSLVVSAHDGEVGGSFVYNADSFEVGTIERI